MHSIVCHIDLEGEQWLGQKNEQPKACTQLKEEEKPIWSQLGGDFRMCMD